MMCLKPKKKTGTAAVFTGPGGAQKTPAEPMHDYDCSKDGRQNE